MTNYAKKKSHFKKGNDMKKYAKYLKYELIEVIKQKNETINRLNGQVYYYKKNAEYYKNKYKRSKNRSMRS